MKQALQMKVSTNDLTFKSILAYTKYVDFYA